MAEFREVMMAAKRMCESTTFCYKCPIEYSCGTFDAAEKDFDETAESKVMQWNEEHPLKTNADRFKEVFGIEVHSWTQHGCAGIACPSTADCNDCKYHDFWSLEYKEPNND